MNSGRPRDAESASSAWADIGASDLQAAAETLEAQVRDRMLPWWTGAVDRRHGGYLLAPDEKQLATQSRMVWVFSHAHRHGLGNYLALAEHGVDFLLERLRDRRYGGFFWKTDAAGRVLSNRKILYGQVFAIYGLVEYFRASAERAALDEARLLFDVIAERAHDRANGGWIEHLRRSWRPLRRSRRGLEVEIPGLKSANTHLHALEALTSFHEQTASSDARKLLSETLTVTTTHFFPDDPRAEATHCRPDWSPTGRTPSSPGHSVELAWLLVGAETELGREPFWTRFDAYLDHALAFPGDERVWWVEAEILAALAFAVARGRRRFERSLAERLEFALAFAIDPTDGVWWHTLAVDGRTVDPTKIGIWKDAFHEIRASTMILEAARGLRDAPVDTVDGRPYSE